MPATETSWTFDDIREAAARIQPIAKRTPVMRSRGFDAEAEDHGVFQMRKLPDRRRIQDPRRVELRVFHSQSGPSARGGRVFLGQPRPGRGDRRARRGNSGHAGDAGRRAPLEARSDAGAGRENRRIRPLPRRPRGHRSAHRGRNRSHAGAALRSSLDHRRTRNRGAGAAGRSSRSGRVGRAHRRRRADVGLLDRGQAPAAGDPGDRRGAGEGQRRVSVAPSGKAHRNPAARYHRRRAAHAGSGRHSPSRSCSGTSSAWSW